MKAKLVNKLANIVYESFKDEPVLFSNWLTQNRTFLIDRLNSKISEDDFFEQFGDESTLYYQSLVKKLNSNIESRHPSHKIELTNEYDGIYICLSEFGKTIDIDFAGELYKRFKCVENFGTMDKGLFYERFCTLFLQDLGLKANQTPPSNDKGIDIVAKYEAAPPELLSKLVFNDSIYLLGQAKFLSGKADVPVLRRLVGDSIFIRFNPIEHIDIKHNAIHLIVFSHNGFTENAIEFSAANKIMRVDTNQMITIIAASKNGNTWSCYNHLQKETNQHF